MFLVLVFFFWSGILFVQSFVFTFLAVLLMQLRTAVSLIAAAEPPKRQKSFC